MKAVQSLPSLRSCGSACALLIAAALPGVAYGQAGSGVVAGNPSDATYEQRYTELMGLQPDPARVAVVRDVVLKRDVGQFTLESGSLYLLRPIGGRTVGAVFVGKGVFAFAPPDSIEQDRLARFHKTRSLSLPFTGLVILFADSTLTELQRKLSFTKGNPPDNVGPNTKKALSYLVEEESKAVDPDLMSAILNQESSDLFYAHVERSGGDPLMFMLNPDEVEGVQLWSRVPRMGYARRKEVVCRFTRDGQGRDPQQTGERTRRAGIQHYAIETSLAQSGIGDISFKAAAKVDIVANSVMGPWIPFYLFEKLRVDSARWDGGNRATVYKDEKAPFVWVLLEGKIQPDQIRPLTLYYHGDLIDRFGDFFQVKSWAPWYPLSLEGRHLATFDLTFHTPSAYLLASVGDRVDSTASGRMVTTRWVSPGPIRNASFNLGLFKDYQVREQGIPVVSVMVSELAHRNLALAYRRQNVIIPEQRKMQEVVGADVTRSLRFFQHVFGPLPVKQLYASEIPEDEGLAFPGMIQLSWSTFQQTDNQGEDELFRAHEVAHQWWGIGVDFSTYHDQWLSEGFAHFSGLWYLQTVRQDNGKYFNMLRRWRATILERKTEPGPISLGYRTNSTKDYDDYSTIVYKKGAWVVHMLRMLMLDLPTMNEDRFTDTMRDFYATYEGKRASTDDFRRIVERHTGADMGWFFNQWVYRSEIPSYRVAYRSEAAEGGQYKVRLRVQQENVPDDFLMYVPVTLDLGKDRVARVRVKVRGPESNIDLPLMPAQPKSIKFNDLEGVLAEVKMVDWRD